MNDSFKKLIDSSSNILILLPEKPFFDQVAAGLSLYLALRTQKQASISCSTPMVVEFNRLIGVNKISTELGNKNLVIGFSDYPADQIERVSYDIENSEFRLTVIPKTQNQAPKKDQVIMSYTGVSADLAILVGGAGDKHFPALFSNELQNINVAHVGTKDLATSGKKQIISFAKPASSNSELVADLIKQIGIEIDSDIATNLLMGVEAGSDNFKSPEVSAETFELIAFLMKQGGKRLSEQKVETRTYPPGILPSQGVLSPQGEQVPDDWKGPPKIYKGTTIS